MIINIQNEIDFDVLSFFCRDRKRAGKTIGLTNGCFDMIHYYHLTECRKKSPSFRWGMNCDLGIQNLKQNIV